MTSQVFPVEAPLVSASEQDALLAAHRHASWRFELLDSQSRVIGPLAGVGDASVSWNVNATVRSGGSLEYLGPPIDWESRRVRVHYGIEALGVSLEWPLGTFIVAAPDEEEGTTHGADPINLDLFDMMHRVDVIRSTAAPWVARAGLSPVDVARELLDRQGIPHSFEDTDQTLRSDMTWPPGTKYLTILNDLMEAAGMFAVWADPMGVIRSVQYRPPVSRGARYVLEDRAGALQMGPRYKHSRDTYSVPNRVVLVAGGEDPDVPALVGTASDVSGPYGTAARGYVISHLETDVSATSQAAIDSMAARRLDEVQRVSSLLEDVQILPVPLDPNDVLQFTHQISGRDMLTVTEKIDMRRNRAYAALTIREVRR